jgi:hypothetical protein
MAVYDRSPNHTSDCGRRRHAGAVLVGRRVLAAGPLLAGVASGGGSSSDIRRGGVFRSAVTGDLDSIDPAIAYAVQSW